CNDLTKARYYVLCRFALGFLRRLSGHQVRAQQYGVGLGLGAATYTGDISRHVDPAQIGIQGTLFGRRNLDNAWSLRAGLSVARMNGADSISRLDPLAVMRDA